MEMVIEISQNIQNRNAIWLRNFIPSYSSNEYTYMYLPIWKYIFIFVYTHHLFIVVLFTLSRLGNNQRSQQKMRK